MKNQNKKLAKVLAATIFGVGFVTPLMFSNIAEAANFGAGGTDQWLSDAQLKHQYTSDTDNSSGEYSKWATNSSGSSSITNNNCAMLDGYRFKIVAVDNDTAGEEAIVTLWHYDRQFGSSAYSSSGSWGTAKKQDDINKAYAARGLAATVDGLISKFSTETQERIQTVTLADETDINSSGYGCDYKTADGSADLTAKVWLPSWTEVSDGGTWGLTSDDQRNTSRYALLRSPVTVSAGTAWRVDSTGKVSTIAVTRNDQYLRPALQIKNQKSYVFTTNVIIPTDGVFTADADIGTGTSYTLNSGAAEPIFTPTSGVTLDGTKIGITAKPSTTADYVTAGLLTKEADSTKNDVWIHLNGNGKIVPTSDKGISYMAQVKDGELDLQNVEGTGYTLKIFGLNTADTAVTELADNAVNGLSIVDGKIHMQVSGTVNAGVPVTASNGAVVDFGGGALTAKLDFNKDGKLEMNGQMEFDTNGYVKQEIGSEVEVPVKVIESDANDEGKAMFTCVDSTADLNVASGNLTIDGPVTDGKYYVLVAGDAVASGDLTAADLWKKEKIALDTSNYFLADFDYVTGDYSIALKVEAVTVEEANTSGLAAVQQGALAVSKEFTGEVENHLGMIANPKLAEKDKYDKEVWATYINTKETTEGMKLGAGIEGNNTAKYNGAVVGVDFYSSKKSIAGLALGYITGDVDSYSGTTATKNDAKYYGVSFYDRLTNGNTALIYDIGYIRGNNDVSQYYNGKAMTSDVKTNTYTAGARWETAIETGKSRVVPFAAFRYMRVNNGDYTNSHNTRFEAKNQNLYIPKVGIAWTGDFVAPNSVCTWRPSVEVGYLWNLGDRSADSNVLVGTRIADVGYDIADRNSFYGKAGIELMAKNFTAGVFYRYLKGNAVKNNKWNINMAWSF